MVITLVNGIEDLHWILHFPHYSTWLILHLPPHKLSYTFNFVTQWVANGSNLSRTKPCVIFMPVANHYKKGSQFESLAHCTTNTWDTEMLPKIGEVGKLGRATQSLEILIRKHHNKQSVGR